MKNWLDLLEAVVLFVLIFWIIKKTPDTFERRLQKIVKKSENFFLEGGLVISEQSLGCCIVICYNTSQNEACGAYFITISKIDHDAFYFLPSFESNLDSIKKDFPDLPIKDYNSVPVFVGREFSDDHIRYMLSRIKEINKKIDDQLFG
jgi:hypothetical protein